MEETREESRANLQRLNEMMEEGKIWKEILKEVKDLLMEIKWEKGMRLTKN